MPADPAPSIAARRPGGLLAPTLNTQGWSTRPASTQASIKDLIAERTHNSPRPPPSPALSESGFSVFDAPATPGSTTFHFEAHHHFAFTDEPFTPDLAANAVAAMGDEYDDERASDDERVILQPVQDHEGREPFPRAGTPPFSPSQTSFATDRLSVQSTTMTDFSTCSPSPSPSIGSVRMATVTKVPMRPFMDPRESFGTHSILSESVEDAVEDAEETIWDARALARTSFVDRLPHDLEAILRAGQALDPVEASAHNAPLEVTPPALAEEVGTLATSGSEQSQLSGESWKDTLEAAVGQLSADPAIKPEDDAMRRMKSILGPKTRIISRAPWDADADEPVEPVLPVKLASGRRSFDVLSMASSKASRAPTAKAPKEPTTFGKTVRSQSFSTLLSGRLLSDEEARERERGLAGLGIGVDTSPVLTPSESKRSFGSLKPSPSMSLGEPLPDVAAASLAAYAEKAMARPVSTRTGSASRVPKVGRTPPPVLLDMVSSAPLASPTGPTPPMSAPASVTLFAHARALTASDSKTSLPPSSGSTASNSPSPSTPGALNALGSSPASPSAGSYFSTVPGAPANPARKQASGFSGHRLISLEEARQRELDRSAAAQRKAASTPPLETVVDRSATRFKEPRTRDSTAESLSSRRGVQSPSAIVTGSPKGAPAPKTLKPKKSGFLKRMMGGGVEKHQDRPQMPDPFRPSIPSSSSIPTLSSATPASSLGRSGGLKVAESLSPSASTGRIAFVPTPTTDRSDRIGKRMPAPALSLRPVSMAFSAGLPADFLANIPSPLKSGSAASPPSTISPPLRPSAFGLSPPTHSASLPILPEPLVSPHASSFKSSVSPNAPSALFDDIVPPSSAGLTTPSTPAFLGALAPFPSSDAAHATPERFAALQDEYASAKRAWVRMQYELETQVKALEGEVQRLRVAAGERRCDKCGADGARAEELKVSVLQRPRAKVSNGAGTLFGSVVMLAHELGLASRIELDYSVKAFPTTTSTPHSHLVPHGKIPALVIRPPASDKETVLYGSENICAYLDELAGGKALPPHGSLARFEVLTTEALASAIKDAALALRYERIERPKELLWQDWVTGQLSKVTRSIPVLAKRQLPDPAADVLGLDGIAAAIALWYVDRRAADSNWRELEGGKELEAWYERVRQRPSWQATPFVK
ncbi:hypothetical protein JCM10449v2_003780 [Rhodotorula kratochvilovae]